MGQRRKQRAETQIKFLKNLKEQQLEHERNAREQKLQNERNEDAIKAKELREIEVARQAQEKELAIQAHAKELAKQAREKELSRQAREKELARQVREKELARQSQEDELAKQAKEIELKRKQSQAELQKKFLHQLHTEQRSKSQRNSREQGLIEEHDKPTISVEKTEVKDTTSEMQRRKLRAEMQIKFRKNLKEQQLEHERNAREQKLQNERNENAIKAKELREMELERLAQEKELARQAHEKELAKQAHEKELQREAHEKELARQYREKELARQAHEKKLAKQAHEEEFAKQAHEQELAKQAHEKELVKQAREKELARQEHEKDLGKQSIGSHIKQKQIQAKEVLISPTADLVKSDECMVKRIMNPVYGKYYNGTTSVTENGYTCQRWDVHSPHKIRWTLRRDFMGGKWTNHNYCRNWGNQEYPWCFTTDPNKLRDYCKQIKICKNNYHRTYATGPNCVIVGNSTTGHEYRGNQSVTENGYTCQNWAVESPHEIPRNIR